jgi:hypothetical protein
MAPAESDVPGLDIRPRPADGVLHVRVLGVLDYEALQGMGPAVRAHPDFDPSLTVIYDFSQADAHRLSREDLDALRAQLRRSDPDRGYPVVHVVPSDLSFGLARIFAILMRLEDEVKGRRRLVARSLDEALEWARRLD